MIIVCLHTKPPAAQHQKVSQEVNNQSRETASAYCQQEKTSLSSLAALSLATPRDSVSIHTAFFVLLTLHLKDRAARDLLALSCSW